MININKNANFLKSLFLIFENIILGKIAITRLMGVKYLAWAIFPIHSNDFIKRVKLQVISIIRSIIIKPTKITKSKFRFFPNFNEIKL